MPAVRQHGVLKETSLEVKVLSLLVFLRVTSENRVQGSLPHRTEAYEEKPEGKFNLQTFGVWLLTNFFDFDSVFVFYFHQPLVHNQKHFL